MKCLWIEDFDKGTKPQLEKFWKQLYELPQGYDIVLKKNLTSALNYIDNKENDFDSVIIDINLDSKDEELGVDYKRYLEDVVSDKLLSKELEDIEKAGGFLIFLKLILERGFPRERMAFLTGNYSEEDARSEVIQEILQIMKRWNKNVIADEYLENLSSCEKDNFDSLLDELGNLYRKKEDEILDIFEEEKTEKFILYLKELQSSKSNEKKQSKSDNTYNEYKRIFSNAGINPSKPYIKQGLGQEPSFAIKRHTRRFKKWIKEMDTNYHTLRRSIMETTNNILKLLKEDENLFIFNGEKNINDENEDICDIEEIKSMLYLLKGLLPLKEPSDMQKKKIYRQVIRIISHYWDTKNPFYPNSFSKKYYHKNIHCLMKLLRNWMAHNKIEENFSEADVGFFFILAIRTYFNLGNKLDENNKELKKIRYYEIKLLELQDKKIGKGKLISYFKINTGGPNEEDKSKSKIEEILRLSFTNITKKEIKSFGKNSISKEHVGYNVYTKIKNIGGRKSQEKAEINDLYKLFWHSIFYSWLDAYNERSDDLTRLTVKFGFADRITWLNENEILTQIFMNTFYRTFSEEIVEVNKKILTLKNDEAIS